MLGFIKSLLIQFSLFGFRVHEHSPVMLFDSNSVELHPNIVSLPEFNGNSVEIGIIAPVLNPDIHV